jgi:uncharacterized RDD family membrane protein YckC
MRVWERLKGWAEKEARAARLYRRTSETAVLYKEGKAGLIRDRELETLLGLWKREQPNAAWAAQYGGDWQSVELFVEASKKAHYLGLAEAELERRWRSVWRPLAIGVVAVISLYVLFAALQVTLRDFAIAQRNHDEGFVVSWTVFFWPVVKLSFSFTAIAAAATGLIWIGRLIFRKAALEGILDYVSTRAEEKAAGAIDTAEEVSDAPGVYAVWWRRLLSWVVDFVIFIVMAVAVIYGVVLLADSMRFDVSLSLVFGSPLIIDWLYEAITASSRWQATLGMRLCGIVATDMGGKRMHFMRASAWHFAKALCWLTFFLGFAVQFFTPKKQGLHDLIARVLVVPRAAIS